MMTKLTTLLVALCSLSAGSTSPLVFRKHIPAAPVSPLGIVNPVYRCGGGYGTFRQLRISECEGRCSLVPGRVYEVEQDFMSGSSVASISLKIEFCSANGGFCIPLLDADLPNSSIQPGLIYTLKFGIIAIELQSGQTWEFRSAVSHKGNQRLEMCISTDMNIL